MKKSILMGAAAMAMLSLAACSNNSSCNGSTCTKDNGKEAAYTGIIPAADCDGIRYTVFLDYDDAGADGDFQLLETYIQSDSTSAIGYSDIASFASEGDFTIGKQGDKTYLKLVKDKDSSASTADAVQYFIIDSDSTITMANSDLETSTVPGMNYTLKIAK